MDPEEAVRLLGSEYGLRAAAYDRHVAPRYARIAERLLDLAEVGHGESVLDLGCGTGNAAFLAAGYVGDRGQVLGIDLAEGMVAVARRKAAELGLQNVRFEVMDLRSLDLETETFDAAVSCFGLPTLKYRHALRHALRVLAPGGRFVSCDWAGPSPAGRILRDIVSRHAHVAPSEDVRRLRDARAVLNLSQDAKELRDPVAIVGVLKGIGFRGAMTWTETIRTEFPMPEDYLAYSSAWRDSDLSSVDPRDRAAVEREFREAVPGITASGGLVVSWDVRFYSARK